MSDINSVLSDWGADCAALHDDINENYTKKKQTMDLEDVVNNKAEGYVVSVNSDYEIFVITLCPLTNKVNSSTGKYNHGLLNLFRINGIAPPQHINYSTNDSYYTTNRFYLRINTSLKYDENLEVNNDTGLNRYRTCSFKYNDEWYGGLLVRGNNARYDYMSCITAGRFKPFAISVYNFKNNEIINQEIVDSIVYDTVGSGILSNDERVDEQLVDLKNAIIGLSNVLKNYIKTYPVVARATYSANTGGLEDGSSTTIIRTDNIPVKKGDLITIHNGSLQHAVGMWKTTISSNTCIRNDTTWVMDGETILIENDGFVCIIFSIPDDGSKEILLSDFDGEVKIYNQMS